MRGHRADHSLARVRGGKGAANSVVRTFSAALAFGTGQGVRPERKIERFLSSGEFIRLGEVLSAAEAFGVESAYPIAAIRLLVMTGCRRNEILRTQRSYVDYSNRCFRLPDSKTGAKVVHVGDAVVSLIRELPQVSGNPYVLPGAGGVGHFVCIQKAWDRYRKSAGLEDVRIHDLRHSFASFGANSGDSILVIGALLGHRSVKSTERYAHLAAHPIKAAAQRISSEIAELLGAAPMNDAEPVDLTHAPPEELDRVRSILGEVVRAKWLDSQAVAERTGLTIKTLQTYRWQGIGPPFHKIGKRVVYSEDLVDRWRATPAVAISLTAK